MRASRRSSFEISAQHGLEADQDLVEAMKQSLTDEQLARQALEQKLNPGRDTSMLSARECSPRPAAVRRARS